MAPRRGRHRIDHPGDLAAILRSQRPHQLSHLAVADQEEFHGLGPDTEGRENTEKICHRDTETLRTFLVVQEESPCLCVSVAFFLRVLM